jgi:hypothetical protein
MEYYWLVNLDNGCLNHFAKRSCSKRESKQKDIYIFMNRRQRNCTRLSTVQPQKYPSTSWGAVVIYVILISFSATSNLAPISLQHTHDHAEQRAAS